MAEMKKNEDWKVISVEEEHHLGMVWRAARECAQVMGFGEVERALIITSVLELARNILVHAGKGIVTIREVSNGEKRGLEIVFADKGPGIVDVERVLKGGYSTKGSLRIGLSGAKRMMDEMEIKSELGKGTTITTRKWL